MADRITKYDEPRLVASATGWTDRHVGDFADVHVYPGPGAPARDSSRALMLGEFGGLGLPVPGHMWQEKGWGYQSFKTQKELTDRFVELMSDLRESIHNGGLSGAVYTQTTDVETELNGLMTYDRALIKMDEARVRKAIADLAHPPPAIVVVAPTSEKQGVAWRYTTTDPGKAFAEPHFDDLHWQEGLGGFGTKDTPGSVVRTNWNTSDIWIRREVKLRKAYDNLALRLSHDDDVEVFLDGKKVYGTLGWTTSYKNIPIGAIAKGAHVLAIHCHQNQGGQYVDAGLVVLEGEKGD